MTAPTQVSPTGWYYADGDASIDRTGWDGRLWPEITGYRGHSITVDESAFVEEVVLVEEAQIVEELEVVEEALAPEPAVARVKPPRLFEVVELKNAAPKTPVEIPEVGEPPVSEVAEPSDEPAHATKSSMRLYIALFLFLIVIALILGVAL